MHREAFIEKLTEIQQNVEQLLSQLQVSEHDGFAAHLYRSRREYRCACQRAGKSGKQIEWCVISTFQVAESMGLQGRVSPVGGPPADRRLIPVSFDPHRNPVSRRPFADGYFQ